MFGYLPEVAALHPALLRMCQLIVSRLFRHRNFCRCGIPLDDCETCRTFTGSRSSQINVALSFAVKLFANKGASPKAAARFIQSQIKQMGGVRRSQG